MENEKHLDAFREFTVMYRVQGTNELIKAVVDLDAILEGEDPDDFDEEVFFGYVYTQLEKDLVDRGMVIMKPTECELVEIANEYFKLYWSATEVEEEGGGEVDVDTDGG